MSILSAFELSPKSFVGTRIALCGENIIEVQLMGRYGNYAFFGVFSYSEDLFPRVWANDSVAKILDFESFAQRVLYPYLNLGNSSPSASLRLLLGPSEVVMEMRQCA